jgi:hypothetical protein
MTGAGALPCGAAGHHDAAETKRQMSPEISDNLRLL